MNHASIEDVSHRLNQLGVAHHAFDANTPDGYIRTASNGTVRMFAWSDQVGWTVTQTGSDTAWPMQVVDPANAKSVVTAITQMLNGNA